MMSKIVSVFIVVTIMLMLSKTKNDNEIEWCSVKKLSWNDFLGKPDTINNGLAAAATFSSIRITKSELQGGLPKLEVKSVFIKDKSWTIVNDGVSLAHEQLHFDISEIYARKIRKAFDSLNNYKVIYIEKYQEVFSAFVKRKREYNKLYDSEVYFNEEKQKQWSLNIAEELEELKEYELKSSCSKI